MRKIMKRPGKYSPTGTSRRIELIGDKASFLVFRIIQAYQITIAGIEGISEIVCRDL
jgi:hypothetical protein